MLTAAVDVGSNTLRLLIGSVEGDRVSRIYADRAITRLAEGIRERGRLKEENIERSLSALRSFSLAISRCGADRVKAVGTSAMREADNSAEFLERSQRETGIRIEVISGTREAELTARGVLAGFRGERRAALIVDIGGGSTEWILREADNGGALSCGTVPVGVVKLHERFMRNDPPSSDEISALDNEIGSLFRAGKEATDDAENRIPDIKRIRSLPSPILIGTGGTVTTLAAIDLGLREYDPDRVHGHRISYEGLCRLRDMLLSMPLRERARVEGLEPGRADLIIPGILLTIRLMKIFGFHDLTVSDYGLLEGLIKEADDAEGF